MGVIPNNRDPELLIPKEVDFGKRCLTGKKKGWEISMHGYSHEYEIETKKNDFLNLEEDQNFLVKVFKIKSIKSNLG